MDIEHAALRSRIRRLVGLVDRGRDAVDVQNARESQPAEAGAYDRDGSHRARLWNIVPIILERRSKHVKLE
jgi:hypothetical protein